MESDRIRRASFRAVDIEHDIPYLLAWLRDPDVNQWYREGEPTAANYRTRFASEPGIHKYIICIDDIPAGYVQGYRLSDEEEYARQIGLGFDAVSIDIFLGNPAYRGGWGEPVLRAFLHQIVFGEMNATWACINPDPKNLRAVQSYRKSGFSGDRVVWIESDEPDNRGFERIMLQSRAAFYGAAS